MVIMSRLSLLVVPLVHADDAVSLLQTKVSAHEHEEMEAMTAGMAVRTFVDHESHAETQSTLEAASGSGKIKYGCQSTLSACALGKCSMWGEPHLSKSFVEEKQGYKGIWGIFDRIGLYRIAWAKDKSWEIQMYSCGLQMTAIAMRFNNTRVEVINTHPVNNAKKFYIDGSEVQLPIKQGPGGINWNNDMRKREILAGWSYSWGTCLDFPDGSGSVEISNQRHPKVGGADLVGNMMQMYLQVDKSKIPIGKVADPNSLCNRGNTGSWRQRFRIDKGYDQAGITQLRIEESIFSPNLNVCGGCMFGRTDRWRTAIAKQTDAEGKARCVKLAPQASPTPTSQEACARNNITMTAAESNCKKLKGQNQAVYADCIFDCCMSTPDTCKAAAQNAELEEEEEEPGTTCLISGDECDVDTMCTKSQTLKLNKVVTSNLDGTGDGPQELRYGSVYTKADGTKLDLVVVADGYTSKKGNSENGLNGKLGQLNVDCGSTQKMQFTFVKTGTDEAVQPVAEGDNIMFSFLDIDQGKRNKGRSSVKVCGADQVLVSTNSELEQSVDETCASVKSTVRGTAKDNPDDPTTLSEKQKARTATFMLGQGSTFMAELAVGTCKGGGRNFMFTGEPLVTCPPVVPPEEEEVC
jgi:hypothetical protein